MSAARLWWSLVRRQEAQRLTTVLAVVAFTTATGALLTVLGGLRAFTGRADRPNAEFYLLCARTATVILVVPVLTLGGAAARLAVSRRDERLASLRLAGATTGQVSLMTVLDAGLQSLAGAVAGVLLYLAALPGVALIRFQGRTFAWSELWVGLPVLLLGVLGVVVLAVVSAVLGLAKIAVSPLGVARRTSPRRLSSLRLVVAVVVLGAWAPLFSASSSVQELTGALVVLGACFGVLNLVGPLVLGLIGRVAARRARGVPGLLAARRLVDDPRSAWRAVAGVSLATFVAGVLSVAPALSGSAQSDPDSVQLGRDVLTGAIVTVVIAALVAAVSSGVTQAARILDHREQYTMLHLAGAEVRVLERARQAETWLPLLASVGIAAGCALVVAAPVGLPSITTGAGGLGLFVGGVVVSVLMVAGAVRLSQPLVGRVALGRMRARDESLVVCG
jgi:hypothetical protein